MLHANEACSDMNRLAPVVISDIDNMFLRASIHSSPQVATCFIMLLEYLKQCLGHCVNLIQSLHAVL